MCRDCFKTILNFAAINCCNGAFYCVKCGIKRFYCTTFTIVLIPFPDKIIYLHIDQIYPKLTHPRGCWMIGATRANRKNYIPIGIIVNKDHECKIVTLRKGLRSLNTEAIDLGIKIKTTTSDKEATIKSAIVSEIPDALALECQILLGLKVAAGLVKENKSIQIDSVKISVISPKDKNTISSNFPDMLTAGLSHKSIERMFRYYEDLIEYSSSPEARQIFQIFSNITDDIFQDVILDDKIQLKWKKYLSELNKYSGNRDLVFYRYNLSQILIFAKSNIVSAGTFSIWYLEQSVENHSLNLNNLIVKLQRTYSVKIAAYMK